MTATIVRSFSTATTVLISVVVTAYLGESAGGKLLAAFLVAAFICAVEWFLYVAPGRWGIARRLLDPRSKLEGVWTQRVDGTNDASTTDSNRFAVFWIESGSGDYKVLGHAFDSNGLEVARWHSTQPPTFDAGARRIMYVWDGERIGDPVPQGSGIDRTGLAVLEINDDLLTGRGRVDHVGMNRVLLFVIERVTPTRLERYGCAGLDPGALKSQDERNQFALAFASSLRSGPLTTPTPGSTSDHRDPD